MEDKLASMTQKMIDLQMKYLDLQENSNDEINKLHHKIHELSANKVHKVHTSHKGKSTLFTEKEMKSFFMFFFIFVPERIENPVKSKQETVFKVQKRNHFKVPSTTTPIPTTTKGNIS